MQIQLSNSCYVWIVTLASDNIQIQDASEKL